MALGKPSISDIRALDTRAIATAVKNIRERIEGLEAALGVTTGIAQTTANASGLQLNNLVNQINALDARVTNIENVFATDIGNYVAGESIAAGQGVVGISDSTVGVADPSDPTRMFGLIGIAIDSGSLGSTIRVQRRGVYTVVGSPGFIVGRAVYIGDGSLTQTPNYEATALPAGVAVSVNQVFVTPDWPALLTPSFSSAVADEYQQYLPITYSILQILTDLGTQIAALSFSSGIPSGSFVPVEVGGIAYRVSSTDFLAAQQTLAQMIAALSFSSGIPSGAVVPVEIGGVAYRVSATDFGSTPNLGAMIAALSFSSGIPSGSVVPVEIGGVAYQVNVTDFLANLQQMIDALPASSGIDATAQIPFTIGGVALRVSAGDLARLVSVTPLTWRDVPGDTTLVITDNGNGLSTSNTTGTQTITIPGDTGNAAVDLPTGATVLIFVRGVAGVTVAPVSGVTLLVRSGLTTSAFGRYSTVTLIKRQANEWLICGDLA